MTAQPRAMASIDGSSAADVGQPRHLLTSDRWLAGFLCADDYPGDADIP
jgi:hypothetical protein